MTPTYSIRDLSRIFEPSQAKRIINLGRVAFEWDEASMRTEGAKK